MTPRRPARPARSPSAKAPQRKTTAATRRESGAAGAAGASASASAPVPAALHADGKWSEWFVRAPGERRHWLVKSEPDEFSFDDLERAPRKTTGWDGVRNFSARNFLRDGMRAGDLVFIYHSNVDPQAIVGIAEVVREGYPDPTALDPAHPNHDPDASPDNPRWFQVDVRAVRRLPRPVTLAELKRRPELREMALFRVGRLSVIPVREPEWRVIEGMA